MKVLYQWARRNPTAWQEVDASEWRNLPSRGVPEGLGGNDNAPGWLSNVNVQGITAEGFDHVAIEPVVIGIDEGVRMTTWNDDPDDWGVGERRAIVWTILPLAPDPRLGMAINTRQSCVWYCEGDRYARLIVNPPQSTSVRPWAEFEPPSEEVTRHGVWLTDEKLAEHLKRAHQSDWGWMHWVDHLPDSETEVVHGKRVLKEQRAQGRYRRPEHTITYYQRDTNLAIGAFAATNEDELQTTTAASATESVTLNSSSGVQCWGFASPASEPNVADWPSGTYHIQWNCTSASTGVTYGNAAQGGPVFHQLASDLASEVANKSGDGNFSGTGLKLESTSSAWDPAASSASDRYGIRLFAGGDSHGDSITLTLNTTDSYADGPWGGGAATAVKDIISSGFIPFAR